MPGEDSRLAAIEAALAGATHELHVAEHALQEHHLTATASRLRLMRLTIGEIRRQLREMERSSGSEK